MGEDQQEHYDEIGSRLETMATRLDAIAKRLDVVENDADPPAVPDSHPRNGRTPSSRSRNPSRRR